MWLYRDDISFVFGRTKSFRKNFIVTTLLKLKVYQIFISCGSFYYYSSLQYLEYLLVFGNLIFSLRN